MAGKITPIAMPKLGMEMTEGLITQWNKSVGEVIKEGDEIADLETDKLSMPYESHTGGVLRRILVEEGGPYPVGQLLAIMADADVSDEDIDTFVSDYKPVEAAPAPGGASAAAPAAPAPAPAQPSGYAAPSSEPAAAPKANGLDKAAVEAQIAGLSTEISPIAARVAIDEGVDVTKAAATGRLGRISLDDLEESAGRPLGRKARRLNASPRALRVAKEKGIDLSTLRGSGPNGRILAADVENAPVAAPLPVTGMSMGAALPVQVGAAVPRAEPVTNMRKSIARRLVQSKTTAPHIYLRIEVNATELLKVREGVNRRLGDKKISVNDLIVRACGLALAEVPAANVQYSEDQILFFDQADIGVAVALPDGLIAPIVRGVDKKSALQISDEVKGLAAKARSGGLRPEDIEGGTFTVSNLGMFGIQDFDAVINPPQAAILAVGAVEERPANVDGMLDLAPMMSLSMSCDHRVIDGAIGAQFLAALKELLENPVALVM